MRLLRTLWTLVMLPCLFVAAAIAQTPNGLDAETGVWPFRSYEGGNIDVVDLATGKLNVNIPLLSYPQRGKLKLGMSLIYTNLGIYIPGCLPSASSGGECALIFPFQSGFTIARNLPGGGIGCVQAPFSPEGSVPAGSDSEFPSVPNSSGFPSVPVDVVNMPDSIPLQDGSFHCTASVFEPDGAIHPMEPINATTFVAADASGYRLDFLPGSQLSTATPNHFGSVLTDRDGVRYPGVFADSNSVPTIVSEDSNGNQITFSGGQTIDTVGRTIPGFPCFPSGGLPGPYPAGICGGTTDYTGCTGPLPIAGAGVWNPPGVDGGTYSIKFCFVIVPETNPGGLLRVGVLPAFGGTITTPPLPTTAIQLQSVVLPNNTAWTFTYTSDGFGNLSQITLPTGGTISYTWEGIGPGAAQVNSLPAFETVIPQTVVSRTVSPNDGTGPSGTWTYNYVRPIPNLPPPQVNPVGPWRTIVTDPAQNDTVHTFNFQFNGQFVTSGIYETLTQFYQGAYTSGQLLKTVQTDYEAIPGNVFDGSSTVVPIRKTTTLDNGLQSKVEQDWDAGFQLEMSTFDMNGNFTGTTGCASLAQATGRNVCGKALYGTVLATREYDFASSPPLPLIRSTSTPPFALSNPSYLNNNLLDLPASKVVTDPNGKVIASTTFGYDETPLSASGITTQLDPSPPAGSARGNLTSSRQLVTTPANSCNGNTGSSATLTHSTSWFDTGEVAQQTDPLGNSTTYSYSSTYAGAFPTAICNALNQCSTVAYDPSFGLKTSTTDPNGQITSYQYDSMGRVKNVTYPATIVNGTAIEGSTNISYNDTPGSISIGYTNKQDANTSISSVKSFDGLARPIGTELLDPEGNIFSVTTYDSFGRANTVSNPYRSTSDPTYGLTQTQYDVLGRPILITHPDGSTAITAYAGRAVEVQDEGNGASRVTRIAQSDALGRLTSVCEVTNATQVNQNAPTACGQDVAGTGFLTNYTYDPLGNLTGASQSNLKRSFIYDSASRLVSATNPESGTTCYQYDGDGNLVARTRPAPNQSNPVNTVTTTLKYDALNRITNISYSDGITPSVAMHYDTSSELGVPLNNTVGRQSAEYVTSPAGQLLSGVVYSYDALSRIIDNSQCTPQNCGNSTVFPVQYSYDLLGKVLTSGNGAGTTFSYSYDTAARLTQVTSSLSDANHPGTLFSGATYNAAGALTGASLGSALNEAMSYDCRGRMLFYASAVFPSLPTSSGANTPGCPVAVASSGGNVSLQLHLSSSHLASRTLTPLRSFGSVLISGVDQQNSTEQGEVVINIKSEGISGRSLTVKVPYASGDDSARLAEACAAKINSNPAIRLRAAVKHLGSAAVIDLTSLDRPLAGFYVSASVDSNFSVPSISTTSSGTSRKLPVLLSGLQLPWRQN